MRRGKNQDTLRYGSIQSQAATVKHRLDPRSPRSLRHTWRGTCPLVPLYRDFCVRAISVSRRETDRLRNPNRASAGDRAAQLVQPHALQRQVVACQHLLDTHTLP
jgi:hypothetical protein